MKNIAICILAAATLGLGIYFFDSKPIEEIEEYVKKVGYGL